MTSDSHMRYARQISLDGFGEDGQDCLRVSRILIVGLGGLGSVAARYLAGAGLGAIGLADKDVVETSNLHRQILFNDNDVGARKTDATQRALKAVNAEPALHIYDNVGDADWSRVMSDYDIILDCTDNFRSRFILHDAAYALQKPIIYAAAEGYQGAVAQFSGYMPKAPCMHCFIPSSTERNSEGGCAGLGVLPTVPGVIGALAATQCLTYLLKLGDSPPGVMSHYDALKNRWRQSRIAKDENCERCS